MTTPTDIVERLRGAYSTTFERSLAREAASEIERLRFALRDLERKLADVEAELEEADDALTVVQRALAAETRRREGAESERDDWMALAGQINADRISDNQMLAQRAEAAEARAEAMEKAAGDRAINALRAAMDDAGVRDSQIRADVIGYFCHRWKATLARQENE